MIHPTVQTAPVEYVPAVRQPPDLVPSVEFVKADGAAFRQLHAQLRENDDREELPDQGGGYGAELWGTVGSGGEGDFGLEEIAEAEGAEESGNEFADKAEDGEREEEYFREEEIGVTNWETH